MRFKTPVLMRNKALMSLASFAGVVLIVLLIAVPVVIVGAVLANRAPLFDPPGVGTRLSVYLRTNIAQTGPDPILPELAPLLLAADLATALRAIAQVALELGWHEITVDEADAQMRAVVVSPVFRFRDDIHVRLLVRGVDRVEAVARSSSRVGRGDLGANAQHIMDLRDALRRRALLAKDGA